MLPPIVYTRITENRCSVQNIFPKQNIRIHFKIKCFSVLLSETRQETTKKKRKPTKRPKLPH